MIARTVETPVHGHYLLDDRGDRLLVGFHGYAETAEVNLKQLRKLRGTDGWSLVAVQALHPFYPRVDRVGASWMTSFGRELAIAENIAYIRNVLASLPVPSSLVFLGFSQGASMAARAAAYAARADGLILLGGDIPPEIKSDSSAVLPPTLLATGTRDEWYGSEKFQNDLRYLEANTRVTTCVFDGGHEWADPFREAAGEFLRTLRR